MHVNHESFGGQSVLYVIEFKDASTRVRITMPIYKAFIQEPALIQNAPHIGQDIANSIWFKVNA